MKIEKRLLALAVSVLFSVSCAVADTAPPSAAPQSASPSASSDIPEGSIEVLRLVLAKSVVDREPVDEVTDAAVGDVVVGWSQIRSGLGEITLTHRWMLEGQTISDVPLVVKSSPWRTWSRKTIHAPGNWTLQVLDPQEKVLQEKSFRATEASVAPPASSPQ